MEYDGSNPSATRDSRASARIMSSDMFRGLSHRARQEECDAMTGALVAASAL